MCDKADTTYSFGPSIITHENSLNYHTTNDNSHILIVSQIQEYSDGESVYESYIDEKISVA